MLSTDYYNTYITHFSHYLKTWDGCQVQGFQKSLSRPQQAPSKCKKILQLIMDVTMVMFQQWWHGITPK